MFDIFNLQMVTPKVAGLIAQHHLTGFCNSGLFKVRLGRSDAAGWEPTPTSRLRGFDDEGVLMIGDTEDLILTVELLAENILQPALATHVIGEWLKFSGVADWLDRKRLSITIEPAENQSEALAGAIRSYCMAHGEPPPWNSAALYEGD